MAQITNSTLAAIFEAHAKADEQALTILRENQDALRAEIQLLHSKLDKQRSFVGGVIFAASSIITAVWAVFTYFRGH